MHREIVSLKRPSRLPGPSIQSSVTFLSKVLNSVLLLNLKKKGMALNKIGNSVNKERKGTFIIIFKYDGFIE